jgi:rod shape-determining protein MreC
MFNFGKIINKYKSGSLLLLLVSISLLFISFSTGMNNFSPKRMGSSLFSIFQITINSTGHLIKNTFNSIGELKELKKEQELLLLKVKEYRIRDRNFLELKKENSRLREQLNFKKLSDFSFESAEIVAQDPGNIFSSLIINKGTLHGIEPNMPVLAYQDGFQGLVGKVIETSSFTSKILIIVDNTSYIAARIQESRYDGLINGLGNSSGSLVMNYVSKNASRTMKEGDLVISSGMQSIYPRGIYIGRVRNIEIPEWQTSLVLEIEPVIDFSRLEYVLILTGEN